MFTVQIIFAPWRLQYVQNSDAENACIFCDMAASSSAEDEARLVLCRGQRCFVVLNKFPYITGHLMVIPYRHLDDPVAADAAEMGELMALAQRAVSALRETYRPQGFNIGMNVGKVAGAGIEDHIHLHVMPRWGGDTNFMTVVGQARIIPEDLVETWRKLRPFFADIR